MKCLSGRERGTCDSTECPRHGYCHCGCDQATKVQMNPSVGRAVDVTRGQPSIYCSGHTPGARAALAPLVFRPGFDARRVSGGGHPKDIPVDEVRPALFTLIRTYGMPKVAMRTGVKRGTLNGIAYQQRKIGVSIPAAEAIFKAHELMPSPLDPQELRSFVAHPDTQLPPDLSRAYHRALRNGSITWSMADRLATSLGHHPCDIWDNWFEEAS